MSETGGFSLKRPSQGPLHLKQQMIDLLFFWDAGEACPCSTRSPSHLAGPARLDLSEMVCKKCHQRGSEALGLNAALEIWMKGAWKWEKGGLLEGGANLSWVGGCYRRISCFTYLDSG